MATARYPEDRSMFQSKLEERDRRFAEAREAFLIDYGYNTARAYWGDLEHLYDWCEERGFDIFVLTEKQFRQYQALLRRRKYSESTGGAAARLGGGLSDSPPSRMSATRNAYHIRTAVVSAHRTLIDTAQFPSKC